MSKGAGLGVWLSPVGCTLYAHRGVLQSRRKFDSVMARTIDRKCFGLRLQQKRLTDAEPRICSKGFPNNKLTIAVPARITVRA
jgi:hypothetical protein